MDPISWPRLQKLFEIGEPAVVPVHVGASCWFIVNESRGALALRMPNPERASVRLSRFKELIIRERTVAGVPYWELAVSHEDLNFSLYLLSLSVAEAIRAGVPMYTALGECIEQWSALIRERALLSIQEQIGLIGELAVLRAIATVDAAHSLQSWTGPNREPHDFRLQNGEVEVKTTLTVERSHTIHGLAQLTPSDDLPLFLCSLQLQPAGAGCGVSLPEMIDSVTKAIPAGSAVQFAKSLLSMGYHVNDAVVYDARYALRNQPLICSVDNNFPALTRQELSQTIGPRADFVRDVVYDIFVPGTAKSAPELSYLQIAIARAFIK